MKPETQKEVLEEEWHHVMVRLVEIDTARREALKAQADRMVRAVVKVLDTDKPLRIIFPAMGHNYSEPVVWYDREPVVWNLKPDASERYGFDPTRNPRAYSMYCARSDKFSVHGAEIPELEPLAFVLKAVDTITSGYRLATPDDVEINC